MTGISISGYPSASRHLADSSTIRWVSLILILACVSFNAVLCLVNTHVFDITVKAVIMSEIIIISLTLLAALRSLNESLIILITGVLAYNLMLALLRFNLSPEAGFEVKIIRDFLISIAFFMLGMRIKSLETADTIVCYVTSAVLAVALYEYFFLEQYLRIFDVVRYYIARGTLDVSQWVLQVSNGLMVSGIRPEDQGRTLLPFLGNHRVSSVFLEPSSLGNFGNVVFLWAVIRSRMEHRFYFWLTLTAMLLIVLSDTRFDAGFLALALVIMYLPVRIATPLVLVMPLVALLGMGFLVATRDTLGDSPVIGGTGIIARLLYSGRVIASFDVYNWLGVKTSPLQTFDSGYGYMISNAGLMGFVVFWLFFMSLQGSSRYFYIFRNVSAAYYATLFCISASHLSIKTAALLWFLLAALSVARTAGGVESGYRHRRKVYGSGLSAYAVKPRGASIVSASDQHGSEAQRRTNR